MAVISSPALCESCMVATDRTGGRSAGGGCRFLRSYFLASMQTAPLSAVTEADAGAIASAAQLASEDDTAATPPQPVEIANGTTAVAATTAGPEQPTVSPTRIKNELTANVGQAKSADAEALQQAVRFLKSTQLANGSYSGGDETSRYRVGMTALTTLALFPSPMGSQCFPLGCEPQVASRGFVCEIPAASALPLTPRATQLQKLSRRARKEGGLGGRSAH